MYGSYRKDDMNKNTSALTNEQTNTNMDDINNVMGEDGNIYFDVVPGNYIITENDTMDKTTTMSLDAIKQEYVRMTKIQDVNNQIIHYFDEKLDKQDRAAEFKMTTADSVQSENDKWTRMFSEARRKHKNFRDEVSRIRCEHFNIQTEAIMYEERNEAFKPDIRAIVEELEILRNKRKLFDEAMSADVGMINEEAEKLELENEKNNELLRSLKSELNKLKLDLLEDDPEEIDSGDERERVGELNDTEKKQIPCLVGGDFDIDLVGIPGYTPEIGTPRAKTYQLPGPNAPQENNSSILLRLTDDSFGLGSHQNAAHKKSVRFNLLDCERYQTTEVQIARKEKQLQSCLKPRSHHWIVADERIIEKDMQENTCSVETKSDESIRKIHRKQQARRVRQELDRNSETKNNRSKKNQAKINKNSINVAGIIKNLVPIPPSENVKKSVSTRGLPKATKSKSASKHSKEPVYSCKGEISDGNANFAKPDALVPNSNPSTRRQNGNSRKQLPPISSAIPKQKNKKTLKVKSVTVENALPCITAKNKTNENGVIYDLPSSSPRPVYADKKSLNSDTSKTRRSTGKKDKISPSEEKAIERGRTKAEKGIKLLGDKKLLNKRQNMIN